MEGTFPSASITGHQGMRREYFSRLFTVRLGKIYLSDDIKTYKALIDNL